MAQSKEQIRSWIVEYLATLVGVPKGEVDTTLRFEEYGIDSTASVGLSGALADWLGVHFEANLTKEHPTIDAVTAFVATQIGLA